MVDLHTVCSMTRLIGEASSRRRTTMATKSATITVDANLATAYNAAPKMRQKKAQAAMRLVLQESPETKLAVPHLSS